MIADPKDGHRYAFRCGECDGDPAWRITRIGDVATTWACDEHLAHECHRFQRPWEITKLSIESSPKLDEVAEINQTLQAIADEEPRDGQAQ